MGPRPLAKTLQMQVRMLSAVHLCHRHDWQHTTHGARCINPCFFDMVAGGIASAFAAHKQFVSSNHTFSRPLMRQYTNDQLFFVWAAQSWCQKSKDPAKMWRIQTDNHSPNHFRVVGSFSNLPEFAQAFSCPATSRMGRSLTSAQCEMW
jgi:predicted metalloendopeptidase